MDGTPTLRMNEFVLASIAHGKMDLGLERVDASKLPQIEELVFEVDGKVQQLVKDSEKRFDELVGSHDLHVRIYVTNAKTIGTQSSYLTDMIFTKGSALRRLWQEVHETPQDLP